MRYVFIFLLLAVSCAKQNNTLSSEPVAAHQGETDELIAKKENLMNLIDFNVGDTIRIDSPKRFIQVFILFTMMQHEEAVRISQSTEEDEEIAQSLNQSREQFYRNLGITEEQYAAYGNRNAEKIAEFLAENEEYQKAYDFILEQGTEF
ncbi:MAG: hypothetical protein ACRCY4_05740 [Brevinema sp.]